MKATTTAASAAAVVVCGLAVADPAAAAPFLFSTGSPDGLMASATRPGAGSPFEIESADDFILSQGTSIRGATFTGLVPTGSNASDISDVVVEIYRVFPNDSDTTRTSPVPPFPSSQVPARQNSPSDVAFASRDSGSGGLTFSAAVVSPSFTALNSVQPGGIHPQPNQTTGGNGQVTGQEVTFSVEFTKPFSLPADHYFFVPQVELDNGDFLWLSAPKPITTGTPFAPDLQSWTRDQFLDPDWLRIGTDIVGGTTPPTFNASFSLTGTIPEPAGIALLGSALLGLAMMRRRMR